MRALATALSCSRGLLRRGRARPCGASVHRSLPTPRHRRFGRRSTPPAFERASGCRRGFPRRLFTGSCEAAFGLTFHRLFVRLLFCQPCLGQLFLGQTGGDRMLGQGSALFIFPNRLDFLAYELTDVSGRCFAFASFFVWTFCRSFLWHDKDVSPLNMPLDVVKAAIDQTSR
jgi:hypothetical protein